MSSCQPGHWDAGVDGWFRFLPSTFAGDHEQGGAFAAVILNGAVASLNPGKAPIAVSKRGLVGVEKTLWICDCSDAGIRIFAFISPDKDTAGSNNAFRI